MPIQQVIELKRSILKEEEGTFVEVPFEMPQHVDEICVYIEVRTTEGERATIDFGIKDQFRIRGWSGGSRAPFQLGKDRATPGYLAGDLAEGDWAVVLGAYQVPAGGCQINLRLILTMESPRWLKGDLHGHSVHSDGSRTLTEIVEIMEKQGMDFVGLMDHNTASQNFAYPKDTSVLFIPGMELTTYSGHCNLFGVPDPVSDFRVTDSNSLVERLREAREKGALISINHPFNKGCSSCSWQWGWEMDYDWVEVWNGPWRLFNVEALDWWQEQLKAGRQLVAVGGSDAHHVPRSPKAFEKHGSPTNWVCSRSRSVKGILEALDQGHVMISHSPEGPLIELQYGSYQMGDLVPASKMGRHQLEIIAHGLSEQDDIKIISEKGIEEQHSYQGDGEWQYSFTISDQKFVRLEVWRYFPESGKHLMASLTNPIYFD